MLIESFPSTNPQADNLVMLHGWAMHSGIWRSVIDQLQARHHLWCVDLPGHGLARQQPWPELPLELIDQLHRQLPGNSIWMGWSLGGLFALQAARQKLCKGLILVASNPCFVQQPHWPHAMPASVFQQFADDLSAGFERALKRFLALEVHGSESAREQLQELQQIAFSRGIPALPALTGGLQLLQQADFSQVLPQLPMPALIIGGRRDRLVPWEGLQQTAERLPNATLKRIPGAGHAPFIGDPDTFSQSVVEFCDGL